MDDYWTNYDKLYLATNQRFIDKHWDDWNLDYLLPYLPENKNAPILDAGCGVGLVLNYLYRKGYKNLWGVDISEGQIATARQRLPKEVLLTRADLFDWLSTANKFSAIVCFDVIEHLPKSRLAEFSRILADSLYDNGNAIVRTGNAHNILASGVRYIDITHETFFTVSSLRQVMRLGGFDDGMILNANACDPLWQRMIFRIRDFFYYLLYRVNKIPIPETYNIELLMAFRKNKNDGYNSEGIS